MFKMKITILIIISFYIVSCSPAEEESNSVVGLGDAVGDTSTATGYDYRGDADVEVTIQPYTNGFKVVFTPVSVKFICSLGNYVVQAGNQYNFDIADNKGEYDDLPSSYEGYVESGNFDSCGDYAVKTTWLVLADESGFDPSQAYSVTLDDVYDLSYESTVFNIIPY